MSNRRTKLQKRTMESQGGDNYDRGQGGGGESKPSLIELLPLGSEFTREQQKSFSSAWKPVWYTGWHTGVLACATSVIVVLFINVGLTIYAATNPEYKMERGIGTLYSGSCDKSRKIGLWLHLGINVLSTLLLSGSNYTQQCLAAPTRSEIDAAHAKRHWMDIGVPSIRNLFQIKAERTFLWIAIGITSIPLHLLSVSITMPTQALANRKASALVSNNHFEPGAYSNIAEVDYSFQGISRNTTTGKQYGEPGYETDSNDIQLFGLMLEGSNANTPSYEDLTPSLCAKLYNTDFMSSHRNLFLITDYTPNATYNNTLLDIERVTSDKPSLGYWMCSYFSHSWSGCDENKLASDLASGHPWLATIRRGEEVEITGCKSEIAKEKCKVQFSLGIMVVIICCNLVKACSMILAFARSREPTLVTLGDAVDSFLRIPDPTTMGICFADRRFIDREWRHGRRTGPETMEAKGGFQNITESVLLANLPQTILSFLYLTYNSIFTCMVSGHEWSLFSHHHRTLRVTSPRPGQRYTYWLQIPYTYAIPLMTLSGLFHWLTSQSIFLARVEIFEPFGRVISVTISTVGYSCIAIISVLSLGILALIMAAGMGYKRFAAEIATVGNCSAAISAACHVWGEDSEGIIGKRVRWGDVGIVPTLGVRHLTFASEEEVQKPLFGEVYSGTGREESNRL
ncbi:hypothetical protein B9Z19DRAFT_1149417 [Tuber borchii]|uniref:DUF6536 domain-containing protein n=1 Tax=Tuber borchii TaxID=42251 RepID=A0A2T6ZLV2_TUBBO|nr:hypothetical protein B9Z19DRAFT_1149417 [Tuber borchii]